MSTFNPLIVNPNKVNSGSIPRTKREEQAEIDRLRDEYLRTKGVVIFHPPPPEVPVAINGRVSDDVYF